MVGILIVGAFDLFRRGLREIINRRRGWKVVAETDNGRVAPRIAFKHRPDLAIVDCCPPAIDAVDVTRRIRRGTPATEVLLFATNPPHSILCDALRAGARGAVLKSDPEPQLISAIETVLRHERFFSDCIPRHRFAAPAVDHETAWRLAPREVAVAKLMAEGYSCAEIAERLKLSHQTIASLHTSVLSKLGRLPLA